LICGVVILIKICIEETGKDEKESSEKKEKMKQKRKKTREIHTMYFVQLQERSRRGRLHVTLQW